MNKINIKKQYKTRSGLPVRIYAIDGFQEYSIHGAYLNDDGWNCTTWHESGYYFEHESNNDLDLIEVSKFDHINIDDRVICWLDVNHKDIKIKGYFAGITKSGKPKIWGSGATSFTAKSDKSYKVFDNCELYIEDKDNK